MLTSLELEMGDLLFYFILSILKNQYKICFV